MLRNRKNKQTNNERAFFECQLYFFNSNDGFLFCSITNKLPKKWDFPRTETTKSTAAKFYRHLLKVRRYLRRQLPIAVINSGGCLLLWIKNFPKRNFKHVLCLDQANIYLFKVNNKSTRKRYMICPKSTIKIPGRRQWRHSGVFIVIFEHISYLFLVSLL